MFFLELRRAVVYELIHVYVYIQKRAKDETNVDTEKGYR